MYVGASTLLCCKKNTGPFDSGRVLINIVLKSRCQRISIPNENQNLVPALEKNSIN